MTHRLGSCQLEVAALQTAGLTGRATQGQSTEWYVYQDVLSGMLYAEVERRLRTGVVRVLIVSHICSCILVECSSDVGDAVPSSV